MFMYQSEFDTGAWRRRGNINKYSVTGRHPQTTDNGDYRCFRKEFAVSHMLRYGTFEDTLDEQFRRLLFARLPSEHCVS